MLDALTSLWILRGCWSPPAARTPSSANDGKAAAALLTSDAVMWSTGTTVTGATAIADQIATTPTLTVKRIAPVTVSGDYAMTFIDFSASAAWSRGRCSAWPRRRTARSRGSGTSRSV